MKSNLDPLLLDKLLQLEEILKKFLFLYNNATGDTKIVHKERALKIELLYKKLQSITKVTTVPDWILNSNCEEKDVPDIVKTLNYKATSPQILRVKIGDLRQHKKAFAFYLWNCHGVQLMWKKGLPQFNVGKKYDYAYRNGEYILSEKNPPANAPLGEERFVERLRKYNRLKRLMLSDTLRDNVRHLQDVEKAKKYLDELEPIMKDDKGGLPDYFYNIFNNDLRQKYKDEFNSAVEDWQEGSLLLDAIREIKTAYANVMEMREDGDQSNQEPEPLDNQKERGHLEDFSNLPLSTLGEGDSNEIDINDIQQGETGDCYMLAAAAALAKVAPQLIAGEDGLIKDKGGYFEVKLYMKSSKFEYDYEPVTIQVSKNVLVDDNNQPLNQKLGDGELWAVVLEKALAQYRGGYDNIVSGFAEQGLGMLTGKRSQRLDFKSLGEQGTLDFLQQELEKGNPITFSTKGEGAAEAKRQITVEGEQQLLLEKHTYALDKVEGKFIHLYNPHGNNHLKIDFEALEEYFRSAYYTAL
jgi:hypothetical protein